MSRGCGVDKNGTIIYTHRVFPKLGRNPSKLWNLEPDGRAGLMGNKRTYNLSFWQTNISLNI
jgi:hypothetical protein